MLARTHCLVHRRLVATARRKRSAPDWICAAGQIVLIISYVSLRLTREHEIIAAILAGHALTLATVMRRPRREAAALLRVLLAGNVADQVLPG